MISKQHYNELIKHHELFTLVASDYIPSGQNGRVQAVEKVHQEHFKTKPTDMFCGSCVFTMLKRMMDCMRVYEYELDKVKKESAIEIKMEETKIEPKQNVKQKTNKKRTNS